MQTEKVVQHIVSWLSDYSKNAKTGGFVVGVSGGIDSAVTSTLCAETGLDVLCLEMPIHQAASQVSRAFNHITCRGSSSCG
jgi:NAD+ synthase